MNKKLFKDKRIKNIIKKLKNEGVNKVSVFGSFSRNAENPDSDIDIIVEFKTTKTLLDIIRIERELEELSGLKIDLLTEDSISPYLIDSIKREEVVIYE